MSPFRAIALPVLALIAGLIRWLLQGSGNVYTDAGKRFYVPDPDLGWRLTADGPNWLGLELLGMIGGVLVGVAAAAWLLRRLERRRGAPIRWARIALWAIAALPLAIPAWAFAGGGKPDGAVERLPRGLVAAPTAGVEGALPGLPAGRYAVVPHAGSVITARLSAGGEGFDARFAGQLTGWWQGAPADLSQPMSAEIAVAAASIDTGVSLRSKDARDDFLHAAEFPTIGFRLVKLLAAAPGPTAGDGATDGAAVSFRAEGVLTLMGQEQSVEVAGTLQAPGAEARARLGFTAGDAILVVKAGFELRLLETPLAADASSFDGTLFPIDVSLVLRARE